MNIKNKFLLFSTTVIGGVSMGVLLFPMVDLLQTNHWVKSTLEYKTCDKGLQKATKACKASPTL